MSASLPDHPEPATVPIRHGKGSSYNPALEAAPGSGADSREVDVPCPRCGAKLIDPNSLGWCMKCGYCKSIEEEAQHVPPPKAQTHSALGVLEFFQMLGKIPGWGWVLISGCLVVLSVSLTANHYLLLESFERALWQAIQIGVGALFVLVGRIWAIMLVTSEEESIGVMDVFFSWHLWKLTIRRLPLTRRPVWIGAWGLTAIICAQSIIGGHEYWYQYYQPKKYARKNLVDIVKAMAAQAEGEETESLEDAIKKFSDPDKLPLKKKGKEDNVDRRPTKECVIIGYLLTDDTEDLAALLVATDGEHGLVFAGIVTMGWTPTMKQNLFKMFATRVRSQPPLPGVTTSAAWLRRGLQFQERIIWVKPDIFCEVHQSGWDDDGLLMQPNFKGFLAARPTTK
jgi:hypothetical protein